MHLHVLTTMNDNEFYARGLARIFSRINIDAAGITFIGEIDALAHDPHVSSIIQGFDTFTTYRANLKGPIDMGTLQNILDQHHFPQPAHIKPLAACFNATFHHPRGSAYDFTITFIPPEQHVAEEI